MVRENELRIGNYLAGLVEGTYRKVESINKFDNGYVIFHDLCITGEYPNDCTPIALTQEILEMCGFEYNNSDEDNKWMELTCGQIRFDSDESVNYSVVYIWTGKELITRVRYLHELQNLFYFLSCGKELEVKL